MGEKTVKIRWREGETFEGPVVQIVETVLNHNLRREDGQKVLDVSESKEPFLGLATTRELLDELRARIEVDGNLDYRTVDGESYARHVTGREASNGCKGKRDTDGGA